MTRTEASRTGGCDADAAPEREDGVADLDASPTAEADAVGERARAIRDEQVEQACSRLASRGELTPARREAVATLADRLVERLVVAPERSVETGGEEHGDPAASDDRPDPDAAATAAVLRALAEE